MYKIQFLLIFMLGCPYFLSGQTTMEQPANRQTSFTAHPLTDLVEPGQKHEYEPLIEGQKVSLPSPTPFQTPFRQPQQTDLPTFRFGVGN